jgi:hypothetical protein
MLRKMLPLALAAVLLGTTTACQSISDSVTSPSRWLADSSTAIGDSSDASADSSNAFSKSSSGSSSGDDEESAPDAESRYREDVRVAARGWGAANSDSNAFARELSGIAASHGVVDWQSRSSTYVAVKAGLREARIPEPEVTARLSALGLDAARPTAAHATQ